MEPARRVVGEALSIVVLHDSTVIEHHDLVRPTQGRQPVGDDQGRAAGGQLADRGVEPGLGFGIDSGRRLVEHDDVGGTQPHPGKRQQLRFAGRQSLAAGPERPMDVTRRDSGQSGATQGIDDGLVGRRVIEQGDVVANRPREQFDLLRNQGHPSAKLGHRNVGDRYSSQLDRAIRRLHQSENQARECGLAAARPADNSDPAAGLDAGRDVVQHQFVVAVFE